MGPIRATRLRGRFTAFRLVPSSAMRWRAVLPSHTLRPSGAVFAGFLGKGRSIEIWEGICRQENMHCEMPDPTACDATAHFCFPALNEAVSRLLKTSGDRCRAS